MSSKVSTGSDEGVSVTRTSGLEYEVFLSFRGIDTRASFTDHLYVRLTDVGIRVFRDNDELRKGENIGSNLLEGINQSKIAIPIFSRGYAASKWCLKELVQIMECKRTNRLKVMPVFYDVTPTEVRNQTGDYGKVFKLHEKDYDENTIKDWKKALREVGELSGWNVQNGTHHRQEGELVKEMTNIILHELRKAYLVVTDYLVGLDHHIEEVLNTLAIESNGVKIVGLHGMGGIGKTTLAKVIYNHLSSHFESHCFLANIREIARSKGMEFLQKRLISNIMNMEWTSISNIDEGIRIIKERFYNKKVLLILDDVDKTSQLQDLMGKRHYFGSGSRIIITTRNKSITNWIKVDRAYELTGLDSHQALQLFSQHAFRSDKPPKEYIDLSSRMIEIAGGLPLSLEVFGSLLCGKGKKEWVPILKKLEKVPHREVGAKLRISFDALDDQQKQIFLDIACFFIGEIMRIALYLWDELEFPEEAIEVLQQMSLIKIEKDYSIWMHDQLRDLGRDIVRQEHMEPKNRSRLWDEEEAKKLNLRKTGSDNIRGINFGNMQRHHYSISSEDFERLPNLKILHFDGKHSNYQQKWHEWINPKNFFKKSPPPFSKLRWLSWHGFPHKLNTSRFSFEDLVMLDLSHSRMTSSWSGWRHIRVAKNLKVLNLTACDRLVRTPDFSYHPLLERLILKECSNLVEIDESISMLEHLLIIDLKRCVRLRKLPKELKCMESLEELNIDWTSIVEIPNWPPMKMLRVLSCRYCRYLNKVSSLDLTANLTELSFEGTKITALPDSFRNLRNLRKLSLEDCKGLETLPESIGDLIFLTELNLSFSGIIELPNTTLPQSLVSLKVTCQEMLIPDLSSLINLKILELRTSYNRIYPLKTHAPEPWWIRRLTNLENLTLGLPHIINLHAGLGALSQLTKLRLVRCHHLQSIPKLPPGLKDLAIYDCESLGLLLDLPSALTCLIIKRCNSLGTVLSLPSSLTHLHIICCESLTLLEICSCKSLQELHIEECNLPEIDGLEMLENLTRLRISCCVNLQRLPDLTNSKMLKCLIVSHCPNLIEIPGRLESLDKLNIMHCQSLERVPDIPQSNDKTIGLDFHIQNCEKIKKLAIET